MKLTHRKVTCETCTATKRADLVTPSWLVTHRRHDPRRILTSSIRRQARKLRGKP